VRRTPKFLVPIVWRRYVLGVGQNTYSREEERRELSIPTSSTLYKRRGKGKKNAI